MTDQPALRDHSKPCEHAPDDISKRGQFAWDMYTVGHTVRPGEWCPGGAEVKGTLADVSPIQRAPCLGTGHSDYTTTLGNHHVECDGRGWLYPDPPKWWWEHAKLWWKDSEDAEQGWHQFCDLFWKVLRMYEYGSDDGE